jgi:2-polyprenyl-3-methyl-5-hydroxy-6-metoxy-1,4-benzoquinol methylase
MTIEVNNCFCAGALSESKFAGYGMCDNCGTLVFRNQLDDAEAAKYYGFQEYWHAHMDKMSFARIEKRATDDMRDRIPWWTNQVLEATTKTMSLNLNLNRLKILEVGCAHGQFIRHLADKLGIAHADCAGVEVDPCTARWAAQNTGCPIISGLWPQSSSAITELFNSDNNSDRAFFTCAFDVLEHSRDPIGFLRGLLRHTDRNGLVFLQVPLYRNQRRGWRHAKGQEHNYLFTLGGLSNLFMLSGGVKSHHVKRSIFQHDAWVTVSPSVTE